MYYKNLTCKLLSPCPLSTHCENSLWIGITILAQFAKGKLPILAKIIGFFLSARQRNIRNNFAQTKERAEIR